MARIELDPKQHIELTALRGERHKVYDLGNGQRRMVCHGKPIHYRTGNPWDEVVLDFEQQPEQFISARNKVSVGFSRGGKADKYLGLRYDDQRQFEVTLLDIKLDSQSQLPTTGNAFSTVAKDLNNQIVHTLPSGLRILHRVNEVSVVSLLEVSDSIEDFEITEELHLKGIACSNEQKDGNYLPDKRGRFNFVDLKTDELLFWINPPWFNDAEDVRYSTLEHSLCEDHGRLIYAKRPTKQGQDDLVLARYPILVDTNIYYSTTADGYVSNDGGTGVSWATTRNAADGVSAQPAGDYYSASMRAEYYNGKSNSYIITRSFFYFDTSNLPDAATVTAAVLKLYGYLSAATDVSAQKGSQADTLTTADYDAFLGSEYGHTSWAINAYNSITFNPTGRSDVNKTGTTKVCCREYIYDYSDSSPTATYPNGCYYSEEAGTTKDPRLEIDYTTGQTVALDALTLASSVPGLTQVSGSASITCDALTLTGSAPTLTVAAALVIVLDALTLAGSVPSLTQVSGAVSITCDALTLASSVLSLTWAGVYTLAMDALSLTGSAESLTQASGAVTIVVDALSLISSAETLTWAGVASIACDALTLAGSAETLEPTGYWTVGTTRVEDGDVIIGLGMVFLDALTLSGSTPTVVVAPGAISVTLNALSLVSTVENLTLVSVVTIALDALTLAGTAGTLTQSSGAVSIAFNALSLISTLENLTVTSGASTIALDALALVGSTPDLTQVSGAVSVAVDTLSLVSSAETLTWAGINSIAIDALTLTSTAENITLVPSAVSVLIDALTLGGNALTAAVVPGTVSINADVLTLVGSAEVLVLVPGATSVACDVLSLVGSAEILGVATHQEVLLDVLTLTGTVLDLSAISWWDSKVDVALGDTVVTSLLLGNLVVTSLLLSDLEVTSLVLVTKTRG